MVIAQTQYGTKNKRRSLVYQRKNRDQNEHSPELTSNRKKDLEFSAKSELYQTSEKPRVVRQSMTSRNSLPFTARS
jgi:hypothetical protein